MASVQRGCAICPRLGLRATHRRSRARPTTRCMSTPRRCRRDAPAAAEPSDAHPVAANKQYHGAKLMMEDSVFAELSLAEASKVQGVRVRQHVNPLSVAPDAGAHAVARGLRGRHEAARGGPARCGGGQFDLMFASATRAERARRRHPRAQWTAAAGRVAGIVDNMHFAGQRLWHRLAKYAALGSVARRRGDHPVPDPHFKKRHEESSRQRSCARSRRD